MNESSGALFVSVPMEQADWISLGVASASAVAAIGSCLAAYSAFREAKRMRSFQTQARLHVYLKPCQYVPQLFELIVENGGNATAVDVNVRFVIDCHTDCPISFRTPSIAPRQRYEESMGDWGDFIAFCGVEFPVLIEYSEHDEVDGLVRHSFQVKLDPTALRHSCSVRKHILEKMDMKLSADEIVASLRTDKQLVEWKPRSAGTQPLFEKADSAWDML